MTLAFVVPGLDEAASEKAIAILQNRLSQEQEAALVLKHAHWNVTGPNFIAVHEMLDPEVEAVLAQADETAERIATLGGTPDGRADAIVRNRTWKSFDAEGRVGTEEYLKALIEYYDAFIAVHEMLDPEVEAVLAQADETAERIATLGGTPDGRADAIVRNRTWKSFDAEGRVGTEEYLKALIEYYDAFIADDRKAIAELDELDVISSNIIQDHVQELEKFQWFMRSHLA